MSKPALKKCCEPKAGCRKRGAFRCAKCKGGLCFACRRFMYAEDPSFELSVTHCGKPECREYAQRAALAYVLPSDGERPTTAEVEASRNFLEDKLRDVAWDLRSSIRRLREAAADRASAALKVDMDWRNGVAGLDTRAEKEATWRREANRLLESHDLPLLLPENEGEKVP